jgi:DNA recombination protein RmuC
VLTTVLLVVTVVLAAAILLLLLGRGRQAGEQLLQQQLVEVRGRLDALAASQQELPRTVAESSAVQARSLADVRERLGRLSEATARLESLGRSVTEVQDLLRVPRLRGTVGEVWLEELLRQVFPQALYRMQYAFRSGERVDAALFVGERIVPIDAKFPLEACHRMLQADGEATVRERRAFRRSLRERIDEVADRYIRPDEGTFDFALMYIPAEAVYYEAVVREESLDAAESIIGYALRRHVLPVSPNTFYAYLAAVLHGLRGLEVEHRAREIQAALGGLRQFFSAFQRTFELVGRHLDHATKQYHEAERAWERVAAHLEAVTAIGGPADAGEPDALAPAEPAAEPEV